ncbi:MAG TPA: HAMP domain-containing sensor histidine kinase [Longimicrobium sp.]|nr:HAMP domain-containing sensor histidine kinase [Longimicrobium sp.]
MRLTLKLTLATLIGVLLVVAGYSYATFKRQVAQFDHDNRAHHQVLGRSLAAAFASAWEAGGMSNALRMLASANANQTTVRIRWVSLNGLDPATAPPFALPGYVLGALARGQTVSVMPTEGRPGARLFTYVPVPLISPLTGAVEISESLEEQQRFTRATIEQAIAATVLLALVCSVIALLFGGVLVARPVRGLVELSERIARGELSARLTLRGKDELATLASAMNRMAEQLAESREKLGEEARQRVAAMEQLRHADRIGTVGKLASGVAHELGTPLNVVAGNARMIASGELAGEGALEAARTIRAQAEAMTRIIRQLLDFARRRAPEKAPQDVGELASGTLAMLRHLADKHRVRLSLQQSPGLVAEVDAGQINQALTNLVMNAVQAMPRGGEVKVSLERTRETPPPDVGGPEGEFLRLHVTDEGEGIAPEVLPHVFEPFFTTKGVGEGTGLGLSVSYGLVREHGGWISARSEPGKGSTFTLHLPVRSR